MTTLTQPTLAFAHLNLRRNPFGDPTPQQRGELAVVDDLDELAAHLSKARAAVQFIGDKGRGKSTHLLALRARFPEAAYVRIGPGERPVIPDTDPLLVDELQNLPRRLRAALFRRGCSLAIGTHVDLRAELRRAGRGVVTIHPRRRISVALLRRIFERRIEWARRGPGRVPGLTHATLDDLHQRFGDDVRAMEQYLYDVFQSLTDVQDV